MSTNGRQFNPKTLQAIRLDRGLTALALADAVGVSRQAVWYWEAGQMRPSTDRLADLAAALGVPIDAFYS